MSATPVAKRTNLFLAFAKSRIQFISCNLANGGIEPFSDKHSYISRNACSAILRQLDALGSSISLEAAMDVVEAMNATEICPFVEIDRAAIVEAVNSKADVSGAAETPAILPMDMKQTLDYPERYFIEAEWQALRGSPDQAVGVIISKMTSLRLFFPSEHTIAKFGAVGQWAQGDHSMTNAIWWRDSIKAGLFAIRRNVPAHEQLILNYPESPEELVSTDSTLFNLLYLAAPPVDPPEDLRPELIEMMKNSMPRRITNGLVA
eukprot:4264255-Pyramimonas_sp.AAC.1